MADMNVLRTAKQALEEGLINEEHFDMVRLAFIKAQQIKAGLDAGFIREEDYMQARDSFLQALDFKVHGPAPVPTLVQQQSGGVISGGGARSMAGGSGGFQAGGHHRAGSGISNLHSPVLPVQSSVTAVPPPPPLQMPRVMVPSAAPTPRADHPPTPSNSGEAPGTIAIPANLPRLGRPGVADGKKSMSGIGVNDACINIFNHIKTRSAYKWVSYKIDDAGAEVVIDQLGATDSTYEHFIATLPENQCRYGVFDYAYANNDTGQVNQKLVFVHWAPLSSTTKSKMMYASTKEFLKGFLEGVGAELQADTMEELVETELVARIAAGMARK